MSRLGRQMSVGLPQPWYQRPTWTFRMRERAYPYIKRAIDVAMCLAFMPLALPILCLCCVVIRLDSRGAPIFIQERTGKGGRRFGMYKLRTMVQSAQEMKHKIAHLNNLRYPDFKIKKDPRVTRVGHLLRRTSLDELPQLFNVLLGEMSLVGPRPTSFPVESYAPWHTVRLEVIPGMTGLAQVNGRCELDFDERLRVDIEYLRKRSICLDLVLLFRTVAGVIRGVGAV